MTKTLLLAALCAAAPFVQAQLAPSPFLLGGEYQTESDLDNGGSFARTVARARVSAPLYLGEELIVGLGLGYQYESYQFSGFASDPWSDVHRGRLAVVAKGDYGSNWSWLAIPWAASNTEDGADLGDALTFGGLGAAWYQFSDTLSLGIGAGFGTQLEDDPSIFPIVVLDWQFAQNWTLTTIPPEGFRLGPGASVRWDPCDSFSLAFIYQYQRDQQRLRQNSSLASEGVGEIRQHRAAVAATFLVSDNISLTAHAGLTFGGALEVLNRTGSKITEEDFDSSLVFGLEGSWRF